jgi:RNA polymerase sigma-70 factor (ECF subfamily)
MCINMNIDQQSEEENIIRRCLDGESDSYSILVDRYKTMVYNVAYRMLGDGDTAKDLAQESFIAAYRGLKTFKQDAKFSSWLYSIVLNKCRDHLRMAKENIPIDDISNVRPGSGISPEQAAAARQSRDLLQQALDLLSAEYREVLVLKHIEELDYQEIAEITGTSVAALKVRAHRGREMLRKILEKSGVTHG